ncbi:regulatory alcR [Fusarium beomiforme]|uniref:Regulatory alcR n=1 Tax=Fusarium beomiforme TaxID=44412 RepID=A0A9P5DWM5_9HYPO|nr:regulatory alcR [Fusarium beomiforme]
MLDLYFQPHEAILPANLPFGPLCSSMDGEADQGVDNTVHSLQLLLWEQAKVALRENTEVECFRIVYAEFIFSITERPHSRQDIDPVMQDSESKHHTLDSPAYLEAGIPIIGQLLSNERPSFHLEQAARKMLALKCRFEMEELRSRSRSEAGLAPQQQQTLGFLYWLLVMFDTVVSPLKSRPVVIADEYCRPDSLQNTDCQWRLDMFLKDDSEMPRSLRWPCSPEIAARAIIKAAPIKVLLYRQLFYIQNALRKQSSTHDILSATKGAVAVCRYWDMTYASFFQGLLQGYDGVSAQLRSWFVCIFTAWNLGTLVLADLVELVYEKTSPGDKIVYAQNKPMDMRRSSAINLAELAGAVIPQKNDQGQLPKYHAASLPLSYVIIE